MKTLILYPALALTTIFFTRCDQQEIAAKADPLDLSGLEFDFKLDPHLFSRFEEPATKAGMASLIDDLSVYIWDKGDKRSEEWRIFEFKVRRKNDELLVNHPSSEWAQKNLLDPCKTKKKTCFSKKGVKRALTKIIGEEGKDGKRDVDIKYRRHKTFVTLEYTFQDC
ncbi:MAG: hypothetical protein V6Z82_05520 [Flavobacteriales bacterium]